MGYNKSFSNAHGQIMLMEPLPPIYKVFSLVLQEEKQKLSISTPMLESTIMFTKTNTLRLHLVNLMFVKMEPVILYKYPRTVVTISTNSLQNIG